MDPRTPARIQKALCFGTRSWRICHIVQFLTLFNTKYCLISAHLPLPESPWLNYLLKSVYHYFPNQSSFILKIVMNTQYEYHNKCARLIPGRALSLPPCNKMCLLKLFLMYTSNDRVILHLNAILMNLIMQFIFHLKYKIFIMKFILILNFYCNLSGLFYYLCNCWFYVCKNILWLDF